MPDLTEAVPVTEHEAELCTSRSTVERALKVLEDAKAINRTRGGGRGNPQSISVLPMLNELTHQQVAMWEAQAERR